MAVLNKDTQCAFDDEIKLEVEVDGITLPWDILMVTSLTTGAYHVRISQILLLSPHSAGRPEVIALGLANIDKINDSDVIPQKVGILETQADWDDGLIFIDALQKLFA